MRKYLLLLLLLPHVLMAQLDQLSVRDLIAKIEEPRDTADISTALKIASRLSNLNLDDSAYVWTMTARKWMDEINDYHSLPEFYRMKAIYFEWVVNDSDSTEKYFNEALNNAVKQGNINQTIRSLRSLAFFYNAPETVNKTDSFFKEAIDLSEKNFKYGYLYDLLSLHALFHHGEGNENAEKLSLEKLKLEAETQTKNHDKALAFLELGNYYWNILNLPTTVFYFVRSAQILDTIGSEYELQTLYFNLSAIYDEMGEFDRAVEYALKSIDQIKDNQGHPNLPTAYNSLGWDYYHMGDSTRAIEAIKRSIFLYKKYYSHDNGIAYPYGNMGLILTQIGQFDSAIVYSRMSARYFGLFNYSSGISESYNNIGMAYIGLRNLDSAYYYLKAGLGLALENRDTYEERNSHKGLYLVHKERGDWKNALLSYERYVFINDSIYSNESISKANQMEKMLAEERDAAIIKGLESQDALNQTQIKQQRIIGYGGLVIFIVILFSLILIFRNWKARKKAYFKLEQKHHELEESQRLILEQSQEINFQKVQIEQQHDDIIDSINFAARIQQALLLPEEHINQQLPPHFILFKPREIVSGDCYWAAHTSPYLYISVIDCTGHGVPGAMMSMLGIAFLNEIMAKHNHIEPAQLLDELRNKIIKELAQDSSQESSYHEGMDMALVRINLETNEMLFAGANNPLWLIRKGEPLIYKGNKQGVSFSDYMAPFTQEKIQLEPEDTFYIFSDGYPDQFGGDNGKKYKSGNFKKTLIRLSEESIDNQKAILDQEFETWRGSLAQIDDVCVIGVKV